tara:strand:+ start:636 stop:839 length:204 start_codon:yes stop_codon:yes gene_type:complete
VAFIKNNNISKISKSQEKNIKTMNLSEIIKIWTRFSSEIEFTTFKTLYLKHKCLKKVKKEYNKKFNK